MVTFCPAAGTLPPQVAGSDHRWLPAMGRAETEPVSAAFAGTVDNKKAHAMKMHRTRNDKDKSAPRVRSVLPARPLRLPQYR
jgi:hypothetical protein